MKNKVIGLVISSIIAACGVSQVQAAANTTVNIRGTVNATTCDVSANTQAVDLGNVKPADFTAINTAAGTHQAFSISLSNCDAAGAGQAQLKVTGPVTNAGSTYFANEPSSAIAVSLSTNNTEVSNNSLIDLGKAGDDAAALNAVTVPFDVALKSSKVTPAGGVAVEAPVTFSFVYN